MSNRLSKLPALACGSVLFVACLLLARYQADSPAAPPSASVRFAGVGNAAHEDIAARAWNTKKFHRPDGRQVYIVSGGPLHYRDEDGWQDIDTTIRPSGVGDAAYEMTRSIYRAFFRERFDTGPVVRMEKDGHAIALTPGALSWINRSGARQLIAEPRAVTGRAANNVVTYAGAYGPGLDFVYEAADIKLSKRLTIPSFSALPSPGEDILGGEDPALELNITFAVDDDVEVFIEGRAWDGRSQDISGRLEFRKNDELLWYFAPPRAWDTTGAEVRGSARLSAGDGRLDLAIAFPLAWLRDTSGAITLDPDTYYGETTDGHISSSVSSDYATARSTSAAVTVDSPTSMKVGQLLEAGNYELFRTYLEFDTSAIAGSVLQANLYLKVATDGSDTDFTVRVHKYNWTSPITAGNQEANYDGAVASTYDADWRSTSGLSLDTYYVSQNLDASWVDTAGTTQYVLLSDNDVSSTAPTQKENLFWYPQNNGTQGNRPYLEVVLGAAPDAPSGLGPSSYVLGGCGTDSTPTLQFTQSDEDVGDTLAFQIQIDDSSDFSSAVVDYQSASLAQGATSFTVGQAAGGGSYTTGSEGQTLASASYYWRVRSYDGTAWGDWSTANGGSVAFEIAATCPYTVGPVGATECGGSGCDYNTLQTAIDAVGPGSGITVYRRTDDASNNECYDEHITIGTANITLQGSSTTPASAACIGPSTGGHIVTITASGVTLKDLHISGKANDGAGGTNSKGNGGRASGHGVYIAGADLVAHVENCTIDFTAEDNIRFEGDTNRDGVGYITVKQCYLHHSDTNRNVRIHAGGGDGSNRHVIRNCLIFSGHGILVSGGADYVTVDRNVIRGWPYWGHLGGSYPEVRTGGFGGGWRYYSNCAAGVWVLTAVPADLQITHNVIVGTRWGIRVNAGGTIRNNTIVNPFNTSQYDFDDTILASDIRDHTFGVMLADGFGGTIQNNLVVVTADNRATGEPGQASSPYYSPGITGYGIAFRNNTGTLGGGANITNNNVWGFVDTDGSTALNYGTGITPASTNLSFDPQFATDTGDESNGGSDPCLADGNDVGDTRCHDLYVDNFFLSTTQASGSCHASVLENTAGAAEYVDLSGGGTRDPDTDDLSGLDDCSYAADAADSRAIDFGTGTVGNEPEKNGDAPNLGAFGRTDRASLSSTLRLVALDVGDGGVKNGDTAATVPGLVQPRSDGLTEVNVYLNRSFSANSSSFVVRDYCDTTTLTAPTVDTSGAAVPPYVATLTWPASTFTDQGVRVHVLGDGADRIVDNEDSEDFDGQLSGVYGAALPSGDGTAGGDAEFAVFALTGDVDGDRTVEGQSGQDDYDAVTGFAGYPAGSCSACPEDVDADGDVDSTDLAAVTAADGTSLGTSCALLSDAFTRADSTTVGNSWNETDSATGAEAQILGNRLDFDTANTGNANEPLVSRAFTQKSAGTMQWTFTFNMERTGVDSTYAVRMQLGDSALLVSPATSHNTGVAVNLKWGSTNEGFTNDEGFGYDLGGSVTEVGVVSGDAGANAGGDATITVTADLDAHTFDLAVTGAGLVSGTGTATGVAFDNNVDIDTVRIYLDGISGNKFDDLEIDDVTITHDPG